MSNRAPGGRNKPPGAFHFRRKWMLFNSMVSSVMAKIMGSGSLDPEQARKAEALKRLQYYHDEQLMYLEAQISKIFSDPSKITTPVFINVTKKIINNLSRVYIGPAKRELVNGTQTDSDIYQTILQDSSLPRKLKLASRYTKLLKTILIRPVWRNGEMDIDILTPDILDVEHGDTPEDLLSITVTHYADSGKPEDTTFTRWTPEQIETLNYRKQVTASEPNPYGILPFIPCWDRTPTGSFWLEGGDDLISGQDAINERLTDLCYVLRLQGFGVPYIKGLESKGGQLRTREIFLGPGKAQALPADGELGFASTNAPISEIIESIRFLIGSLAISHGLSAHILVDEPSQESGVSKMVSSQELDEIRADDIELFRDYEHSLFDIMRVVWNTHNPARKISDKAQLKVDFFDPAPQVSPEVQAAAWNTLLDMGVISAVDVVMERNPDIKTREDALAFLIQIQQEQQTLNERII